MEEAACLAAVIFSPLPHQATETTSYVEMKKSYPMPDVHALKPGFLRLGQAILFRQNYPKPLTPRPASSDGTEAG